MVVSLTMENLEYEYRKAAGAFGLFNELTMWQVILLAPIAIPVGIFWAIVEFFLISLPDAIFNVPAGGPPTPANSEDLEALRAKVRQELEEERQARIDKIIDDIFS